MYFYFDSYFAVVCSYVSNLQYESIDSRNCSVPISQQTVTWINVEQYLRHQLLWLKHYEFVLHILSTARSRFCEYVKRMAFYGCLCCSCIFLCMTTCKRCIQIPVLCCVFYLSISNISLALITQLAPLINKTLPEPMRTYIYVGTGRHRATVS